MTTDNDNFIRPVPPAEALEMEARKTAADNSCFDSIFSARHQRAQIIMRDVPRGDVAQPIHELLKQSLEEK